MNHKLPELFELIIAHDAERPGKGETIVPLSIVSAVREWRTRRNELTVAAQHFIKRQRGSGGGAGTG